MTRRDWFRYLVPAASLLPLGASEGRPEPLRGRLERSGEEAYLLVAEGPRYRLDGDKETRAVLADERVPGLDFEVLGHREGGGPNFVIGPIHTKAMWVHRNGQKFQVTYWCDVCYIRTYSPGICWCCQKYTDLDLRNSESL